MNRLNFMVHALTALSAASTLQDDIYGVKKPIPSHLKVDKKPEIPEGYKLFRFKKSEPILARNYKEAQEIYKSKIDKL